MKKYKRETLEELYRGTGKYWNTGDTDYLDTVFKLAQDIDAKFLCEIEQLAALAVRKHKSIDTLIEALALFGYAVKEEEKK